MPKPVKPITIAQINAMSKEEINALNAKLGRQVIIQFGSRMLFKWGLIFGAIHLAKKYVNMNLPDVKVKNDAGD